MYLLLSLCNSLGSFGWISPTDLRKDTATSSNDLDVAYGWTWFFLRLSCLVELYFLVIGQIRLCDLDKILRFAHSIETWLLLHLFKKQLIVPLFLIFVVVVIVFILIKRVDDDSKDEVHGEKCAEQHNQDEENHADSRATSVTEVIHEVNPGLEGEDLEDGEEALADIIEARDTIHDELNVADSIVVDRIKTELVPSGATDSRGFVIWECIFALTVFAAEHDRIVIFAELRPADKVAIFIVINELGICTRTAELILLS